MAAFAAVVFLFVPHLSCSRERSTRFEGAPVILISIDTLRSDHLPAYGYRGVETPAIDALRADSVLFDRAYAHAPMTLPSHVSMLAGTLPGTHGVRNNVGNRFDSSKAFWLPCVLAQNGYATGAAVSTYVLRGESGIEGCFGEYEDSIDPRSGGGGMEAQQRPGRETLELARRWIEGRQQTPFFYFFHIYEPHVPYEPPEPFRTRYASGYDGEIAASDAIVGELLGWLRAKGIYDRAVIILLSDHGEGLGDHGEEQHSVLVNRELLQVPLMVKLPGGARKGTTEKAPVQLADIAPTVLDLLGLPLPEGLAGMPLFRGPLSPDRPIFGESLYPRIFLGWSDLASLVQGKYHYIDGPRPELYDLVADFRETRNLVATERRTAAAMKEQTDAFRVPMEKLEPVDPETARRMAALGYIGSAAVRTGPLPDPKEHIGDLEILRDALQLGHAGRHREGIARLRAMLERSPGMVEGWAKLGELLGSAGSAAEAADAYRRAVAASPAAAPDLLLDAGTAALSAARLDEAEALARAARAAVPSRGHELLARVAMARGRFPDAEREARMAAGDPPRPSMLVLVAEAALKQGRVQDALGLLDEAERRAKTSPVLELESVRGDAFMQRDEIALAESSFRREIERFPTNLGAWSRLCVVLHMQGKQREGRQLLESMVARNPGPRAPLAAARTLEVLGDPAGAARWRSRATALSE